uniref:Uncharacterized protein n=1 Tax=Avena sativa TaxID=4498 RepID=A0ACD5VFY1_AVESA
MAAPPPVLTVAVEKGPRQGETRQCRAGASLRVGRVVKGNDLAVRDGGASQQHLLIEYLPPPGAGWAVSDLGTSNGTVLNGAPLVPSVPAPLYHGDLIKVGDSTVLAVSMASDSDPNPVANPSKRRTSRRPVAVVEEEAPVVTRRGTRNKTAAKAPEVEKEEPDAAAVLMEEKPPAVPRRGTRSKAPPVAEPPEVEKEDPEATPVVVEEKPQVARRRGGRKKLAPGQMDETAEAPRQGEQKKAPEPSEPENDDEQKEEAVILTRRGSRKSVTEPPEPKEEEKEENAPVVTRRAGRRKTVVTIAPPPLPPKTKSVRANAHRAASENGADAAAAECTGELEEAAEVIRYTRQKNIEEHHAPEKVEEETTVVTRRGRRKEVAEQSEPGKDEQTTVVTRRGGRKKVMEQPETNNDVEETTLVTRRGGRKKVADQLESEKDVEEITMVTRRGGRKKVVEQPEPDKKDVEKEEGVPALIGRGGRKKNALMAAPPSLPPKTSSTRGRGRATRISTRKAILEEDEEQEGKELGVSIETIANPHTLMAMNGGEEHKGDKALAVHGDVEGTDKEQEGNELGVSIETIANPHTSMAVDGGEEHTGDKALAVHGDVEGTVKALEEELPKGRARAKLAASKDVAYAAAPKLIVETEEASEAPRRGRRRKAVEPLELEKEEEEEDATGVTRRKGQKKAAVVTCRTGRKKGSAMVAPVPLPPKTGSCRGRIRVTRTSARNTILEEDKPEQEEDEVAVPREQARSSQIAMAVNGGEDRDVKGTVGALEDDAQERRDDSALRASSDKAVKEVQDGARCSSIVDSGSNGIPNTTSKYREDTKLKAYSTPFDVRLDRALKKYSS